MKFIPSFSRLAATVVAGMVLTVAVGSVSAQKKYDTGATDTEIKLGMAMPYSGPVSSYGKRPVVPPTISKRDGAL